MQCLLLECAIIQGAVVLNCKSRVEVMLDKNEKDTRYPNRFKVTDGINGQFTEISAESPGQMNEWVEAIKVVSSVCLYIAQGDWKLLK